MPSRTRSLSQIVQAYTVSRPSEIDASILRSLRHHAGPANVILPFLEDAIKMERNNVSFPKDVFWIICTTQKEGRTATFDLILSSTYNVLGNYPIFIHCTRPSNKLDDTWLAPRITALVGELTRQVNPRRVYSVFAMESVAQTFADIWTHYANIAVEPDAYYEAMYTFCTKETFRDRHTSLNTEYEMELRRANRNDIHSVAALCHGFASTSEPFTLTKDRAVMEAEYLINKCRVWVHEVILPNQTPEVTSIVAVSRDSEKVSAVTKVYTDPKWRKRGYAECLVRHATRELLFNQSKDIVVLYVAHNNPAASTVYSRVGFQGLRHGESVPGVERWLELGFDQSNVDLGHW